MQQRSEPHGVDRGRGHETYQDARDQGETERCPGHCGIDLHQRRSQAERGQQPRADCQPTGGAADRDQGPFDQLLPHDIEPSGADGEACAQLIEARARSCQRDVAKIPHSNHEHRQRGPPQEIEWASHVSYQGVLKRLDAPPGQVTPHVRNEVTHTRARPHAALPT